MNEINSVEKNLQNCVDSIKELVKTKSLDQTALLILKEYSKELSYTLDAYSAKMSDETNYF